MGVSCCKEQDGINYKVDVPALRDEPSIQSPTKDEELQDEVPIRIRKLVSFLRLAHTDPYSGHSTVIYLSSNL